MMNQVVLIGRITSNIEMKEGDNGNSCVELTLAVQRNYKNEDGVYETDFVDCVLYGALAEHTVEYCTKGDLVGVKGTIRTDVRASMTKETKIVAEKVSFLASKPREDE